MSVRDESAAKRHHLYVKAGEVLHLAQTLELYASALIRIANDQLQIALDVDGLILPKHRDTLGQLLGHLRSVATIDDNGIQVLEGALRSRNYVLHHFFNRNAHAFSVDEVFRASCNRLETEARTIAKGVAVTGAWVKGLCEALKIDEHVVLVEQDGA